MPSVTLALDLGTKTGYAVSTTPIIYGTESLIPPSRFSGGGYRFLHFQRWLGQAHLQYGFEEVVFEAVHRHAGTAAAHIYGGLLGILTAFCEEMGVPYRSYGVGSIKKHVTGKGNAGKDEVISAVQKQGFAPADDNAADAIALLLLHLSR